MPLEGSPVRLPYLPALYTPALRFPENTGKMLLAHHKVGIGFVLLSDMAEELKLLLLHGPLLDFFIEIIDSV